MKRMWMLAAGSLLFATAGCDSIAAKPVPLEGQSWYSGEPSPGRTGDGADPEVDPSEFTGETDRDRSFTLRLRRHPSGLIRKADVGLDAQGRLQVVLERRVEPEDALGLCKDLLDGSSRSFPDRKIVLSMLGPANEPILQAYYRPWRGVRYRIIPDAAATSGAVPSSATPEVSNPLARSGVTEADTKFASSINLHIEILVQNVQADLDRHGRLWFSMPSGVASERVLPLVRHIVDEAHAQFPGREIKVTVFDSAGERIGEATFDLVDQLHWSPAPQAT